jgi:fructose/tagatose bisphosphate aldolase
VPVKGVPAFDAVALTEIEAINFIANDVALVAHGAFVNTATGNTYGSTTCRRWSQSTIDKLKELREAMEQDLAALVFHGTDASVTQSKGLLAGPGGIAEHAASSEDVPSV